MNFQEFLTASLTPAFWRQYRSYCFVGTSYPLLWFSKLFAILKERDILPFPLQRINVESIEKKALDATLHQSILGNYSFFWFGSVASERENKNIQQRTVDLCSYRGPHSVALFTTKQSKNIAASTVVITIPNELNANDIATISDIFLTSSDAATKNFIKRNVQNRGNLEIESCCLLLNYIDLIGPTHLNGANDFLETVTGSTHSLSQLSEQFFAKNAPNFFQLWSKIHNQYPDIFWIFFWAEQTWRAHHVLRFLAEKNFVHAKKIGFRLPYAFMNRDWQKSSAKELANAYKFLYHLDYALKTGSTFCSLDLFYAKYFTGEFAQRHES
jgi:hypothetical protein